MRHINYSISVLKILKFKCTRNLFTCLLRLSSSTIYLNYANLYILINKCVE